MKTLLAPLVAGALLLAGCALFTPDAPVDQKAADVKAICYAAGSIGTEITLAERPATRPAFEAAYVQLDKLVVDGKVTGSLLRGIVASLPFKELKEPAAVAAVNGLTVLFDATVGDRLNIQTQPYVVAAATGLRDGMKTALGSVTP